MQHVVNIFIGVDSSSSTNNCTDDISSCRRVKPLFQNHPETRGNVTLKEGWSLVRGSFGGNIKDQGFGSGQDGDFVFVRVVFYQRVR